MRSITFAIGLALAVLGGFAAAEPGASGAGDMKAKMDAAKRDAGSDLRAKADLRADMGKYKHDAVVNLAEIRNAAATMDGNVKSDLRAMTGAAKSAAGPAAIKMAKTQTFTRTDIANAAAASQYRLDSADKAAKQVGPANKLR
jgi:hypothetical protein